ncbi:MAG: hypothetical protein GY845_06125 [Planctomycetes bacterium]|nr:hypothetical protein [Planctomycetota bacterium]
MSHTIEDHYSQNEGQANAPRLTGDVVTDRCLWNLSMVLAEIAQNPTAEADDGSLEATTDEEEEL